MLRPLYIVIFKLIGWKITGRFPENLNKYIVAVAPHTSNWDFVIGVMARSILRMKRSSFLGKNTLFKPPFGWFFRWLGGYPVDRSKSHDMVQQVVNIFDQHEKFILAMAPEGTRKKVTQLRTGFYYIALGAKVPIVPVGFDFSNKEIVIKEPFYPTGDSAKDIEALLTFYRGIKGYNPELGL